MKQGIRNSMIWLHTWSSLILGWLLFAVFLTGTIAYFHVEVSHWMKPERHASAPSDDSLQVGLDYLLATAPNAKNWEVEVPDARNRTLGLSWENYNEERQRRRGPRQIVDATTGEAIDERETRGGGFLYRFHFELHHLPRRTAFTIVGIASMMMFVGLITGIFTRRKLFAHFFTFRPKRNLMSWIDAHVVTGLMALPFHIMITLSGLMLFANTLLILNTDDGDRRGRFGGNERGEQVQPHSTLPPSSWTPDIAAMRAEAERRWQSPIAELQIEKPLSSEATFRFSPQDQRVLTAGRGGRPEIAFDYHGNVIEEAPAGLAASGIQAGYSSLRQLHEAHFADTVTRWLFFFAGVLGTFMCASGSILWVVKRRRKQHGQAGFELVNALNVGGLAGLMCAVGAYFWANRLLPANMSGRLDWEIHVFFAVWALCMVHAVFFRHHKGWVTQLSLGGFLFAAIPVLDALTSPVSLWQALMIGDWLRLGFDGICLLFGGSLFVAVYYLALKDKVGSFSLANLKKALAPRKEEEACY